jgi:hypothetical protein
MPAALVLLMMMVPASAALARRPAVARVVKAQRAADARKRGARI